MKTSWALVLVVALATPALAQGTDERLRGAKELFFDRKYVEARQLWQQIGAAGGPQAEATPYWIARCSESLGEHERAFREYGEFLARRPVDLSLAEEARTSRVGLAAKLYKAGQTAHLDALREALLDPSRSVRYYAALQLGGLGRGVGEPAIPVLREIVEKEKDPDLADRARLILLRLDPKALQQAESKAPPAPAREATWLRVRIYKKGQSKPEVSINMPVALAELLFKSLPEDAKHGLRKKGYDAETFWERLKKLGPTQILEVNDEDGSRIQIWVE